METLTAIHTRRSIRKYTGAPIDAATVKTLLAAAMAAPSAGNAQVWRFVVVTERALLDKVPFYSPYASMAVRAPLGILVCADTSAELYPGYWVQDCSAAMQNMLLAAHAIGLGAVWTGVYPMTDRVAAFRREFLLPEQIMPLGFAVIGYPAQEMPAQDRYDEKKVHYNCW